MEINDFLAIAIVGATVSFAVQWVKARYNMGSNASKLSAIGLSVVVGSIYWFLRETAIWESILGVLASASTVYAMFFKEGSTE